MLNDPKPLLNSAGQLTREGLSALQRLASSGPHAALPAIGGGGILQACDQEILDPAVAQSQVGALSITLARLTNGPSPITALTLTAFGNGYTSVPNVVIAGGDGQNGAATCTISTGITSVIITNGGQTYGSPPTVQFTGGGGQGAQGVAVVAGNQVIAVNITNPGSGYTSAPTVQFTGGGGSGAAATANIGGVVNTITLTNPGSGYTFAPSVTFTGGGGTGAAATANINTTTGPNYGFIQITETSGNIFQDTPQGKSGTAWELNGTTGLPVGTNGSVVSVSITNGGNGYTSAPALQFTGGGGQGAGGTVNIANGQVNSVTITSPGSGYTSAPAVTFSGGGGQGAQGAANMGSQVREIVWQVPSGIWVFQDRYLGKFVGCRALNSQGFTVNNSTAAIMIWTAVDFDTNGFSNNIGAGYMQIPQGLGGYYLIGCGIDWGGAIGLGNMTVTGVTITNPGSGYTSPPTVSFQDAHDATGTATVNAGGQVTGVTLTSSGNYTGSSSPPSVFFPNVPGGGTRAQAIANLTVNAQGQTVVGSVTITNPGSGYNQALPPVVQFLDINDCLGTALISGGQVTGVTLNGTITNSAFNGFYNSPPTVVFGPDGGGSGAAGTAVLGSGSAGTARAFLNFLVNGSTNQQPEDQTSWTYSPILSVFISMSNKAVGILKLNDGDKVSMQISQTNDWLAALTAFSQNTKFWLQRIGS